MDEIHFYRANEKPYGVFSNLCKRTITFEGDEYQTSEHAYQAGKARKEAVKKWLMDAPSPSLLAMAAHGLYVWDVAPDWSKTKFDRMRGVLYAKFTQHEDLRDLLLSTGNARLVEVATVDNAVNRLWGEVNGVGQNMLGVLLMELREQLRAELKAPAKPKTQAKPKTEAKSKLKAEPKAKAETKTKAEPKAKAETKTKAEPKPKTAAKPKAVAKPKADAKPTSAPRKSVRERLAA